MQNASNKQLGNSDEGREALLKEFGITEDNIKHACHGRSHSGGHRDVHMRSIKEIASELLDETPGVSMFCAETVLRKLRSAGMGRTVNGDPIRSANAIGDALGRHGLCLPCVTKDGKRRFLLTAIDFSEEKKIAAQETLDALTSKELRAMPVA